MVGCNLTFLVAEKAPIVGIFQKQLIDSSPLKMQETTRGVSDLFFDFKEI